MAPITWRNINTPDLSGELALQSRASEQMVDALDPLKQTLKDAQARNEDNFANQTKQNTLALEAELRNTTDISQLDQNFNHQLLRNKLGATYDPTAIDAAIKSQESKLRQTATNDMITNAPAFKSNADIDAHLAGVDRRTVDVSTVREALVQRMQGERADVNFTREQSELAKKDALNKAETTIAQIRTAGGTHEQAMAEAQKIKDIDTGDLITLGISMDKNLSMPTAREQQQIDNFTTTASAEANNLISSYSGKIAGFEQQLAKVSPISEATKKQHDGLLAKGTNISTELIEKFMNGWDTRGNPEDLVEDTKAALTESVGDQGEAELIMLEAYNNVSHRTDWWGDPNMDQQAFKDEVSRIQSQRAVTNTIKQKIFIMRQALEQTKVQLVGAAQMQAGDLKLQMQDPKFNYKGDHTFDPSNITQQLETNIAALQDQLSAFEKQKPEGDGDTASENNQSWSSSGSQRAPHGKSGDFKSWKDWDSSDVARSLQLRR